MIGTGFFPCYLVYANITLRPAYLSLPQCTPRAHVPTLLRPNSHPSLDIPTAYLAPAHQEHIHPITHLPCSDFYLTPPRTRQDIVRAWDMYTLFYAPYLVFLSYVSYLLCCLGSRFYCGDARMREDIIMTLIEYNVWVGEEDMWLRYSLALTSVRFASAS